MKAALRTLVVLAAAALLIVVLLPFWNAAAMILRAAGTAGPLGRLARWESRAVSDTIERVPAREGPLRARVFRPSGRPRGAVLLVSGVHPDGIEEPRLVSLARDLAGTGVAVVTPEIRDLTEYRLTAAVTDAIEDSARWIVAHDDLSGGRPIGMIGVSFSGGLSIVAAGRPRLRGQVAYVLSIGGHGDLPRVLRYLCTGSEPGAGALHPPHDYAVAVVLHQASDLAVPAAQVAMLRRGLDLFLRASAAARTDQTLAAHLTKDARAAQAQMPEPAATLLKDAIDRNVVSLGQRLLPYLDRLGQDPSLSPDRSPVPAAPVYLLHGRDDNVIPSAESALLETYLQPHTRVRRLETTFLSHVDVAARPTPSQAWRMIAFWAAALGEKGNR